jgi:hypothetical protein
VPGNSDPQSVHVSREAIERHPRLQVSMAVDGFAELDRWLKAVSRPRRR